MNDNEGRERLQKLIGEDYRLQWIIGHGGMSTVWLADDVVNDREVAIKVLRPEFSDNREFLDRFRNEASTAKLLDSDNVVRTYDYREIPDPAGHTFCFIAMEYIRGESLADLLSREKQLPESLALDVLEQAAHGLSIIHRMNLVHRDIKPGNLMVTQNGQVKITDFGIAKAAAAVPLTRTGMVVGTAQYVSPEQAQGKEVTAASDIYSLGVVGYEMLAGQRPFTGDSSVSVALAHIGNAPPPLSTQTSATARELIGIALRKEPTQRFANGNEMALAVSAVRLGNRPPQPASAAMTQLAPEPSPTESTRMLGAVAHPTTVHPAAAGAAVAASAAVQAPRKNKRSSNSGFITGVLMAVVIAGLLGGGMYLASRSGLFEGDTGGVETSTPETTVEPEIVTEWVTPTPTRENSTPEPAPPTTTARITPTPTVPTVTTPTTTAPEVTSPTAPATPVETTATAAPEDSDDTDDEATGDDAQSEGPISAPQTNEGVLASPDYLDNGVDG
ncbi:serine/threonine-protein kinase [Corynebacterium alimapuense]|uniref:non-specific serine/threonine protein kinase n=1 Tax=Corynebacterium alimapuense TaxID=1576874 RepID=A0A3M8K4X3_9CORY|nr:serine/threonine-protein kinase [Corynebacterium alimapuense]RNE48150.1 serine/threonine protein kinase [Corynebacterium alimapuense]